MKKFILLFFLLLSNALANECSPYMEKATINEVHNSGNNTRFIEIKILDTNLNYSVYKDWTLRVESRIKDDIYSLNVPLVSQHITTDDYPWIVLTKAGISSKDNIDFGQGQGKGMEIRLNDANGNAIDYLSVAGYEGGNLASNCGFKYPTTAGSTNSHTIYRSPDGVGDWNSSSGNSRPPTPGRDNSGEQSQQNKSFTFNAVDSVDGCFNWENKIRTKIANKEISLVILSRDDNGLAAADASITQVELLNYSDLACSVLAETQNVWNGNAVTNAQGCFALPAFTYPKATRCAQIKIYGENNVSISSDSFAVRPESFSLSLPSGAFAGENFLMDFNASSGINYNETKDSSFVVESNNVKALCNIGVLNLDNFSFSNGERSGVAASYTNIGDLNITIKERLGSEYARIDAFDTLDADRLIAPYSGVITVLPYELNVTLADINTSTGASWLYMADVNDVNLSMSATVRANNMQGQRLEDFNTTCYAQDVNISFAVVTDGNAALDMNYSITQGEFVTLGDTLGDINRTLAIRASDFLSGEGQAGYSLNVDREFSAPVAPFNVGNLDANVTTTNISKVVNGNFKDGNFTFYYGRARAKDIKTSQVVVDHFAEFEVYDPQNYINKGFKQNSLNWYRNNDHNATAFGNISSIESQPSGIINSLNPINSGLVTFSINNSAKTPSADMHIRTDEWLWYTPIDNGFDNTNIDCSQHPCFKYAFTPSSSDKRGIQSGSFDGSDIDVKNRGDYQKTGIKVFR